jgi:hypothetical protein
VWNAPTSALRSVGGSDCASRPVLPEAKVLCSWPCVARTTAPSWPLLVSVDSVRDETSCWKIAP